MIAELINSATRGFKSWLGAVQSGNGFPRVKQGGNLTKRQLRFILRYSHRPAGNGRKLARKMDFLRKALP